MINGLIVGLIIMALLAVGLAINYVIVHSDDERKSDDDDNI